MLKFSHFLKFEKFLIRGKNGEKYNRGKRISAPDEKNPVHAAVFFRFFTFIFYFYVIIVMYHWAYFYYNLFSYHNLLRFTLM